jgi:hypothetical protein
MALRSCRWRYSARDKSLGLCARLARDVTLGRTAEQFPKARPRSNRDQPSVLHTADVTPALRAAVPPNMCTVNGFAVLR